MKLRPRAFFLLLSGLILVFVGCNSDPRATVSGKVTYKEKPLSGGAVTFVSEDGARIEKTPIDKDGNYSSPNVPVGNCKISVDPAPKNAQAMIPKGEKKFKPPEDSPAAKNYEQGGEYVDIPAALRDPAKSGITFKVESGVNSFNIPLKDK